MAQLSKRISALESSSSGARLHPALRRWLGIQLTEAESIEADNYVPPAGETDWSSYSPEVRQWLQQD